MRKGSVVRFLYESGLIARNPPTLNLSGANLHGDRLKGAILMRANLSGADLEGADLLHNAHLTSPSKAPPCLTARSTRAGSRVAGRVGRTPEVQPLVQTALRLTRPLYIELGYRQIPYHATPERCCSCCYSARQDETGRQDRETGRMTRQRVTTKEAAEALGISVEAVRKRIERGQLGHERVDGRVYVYLDGDQTESGPDVEVESTALISEKNARIELLERQLTEANERDRENRRIIAALTQRIPQLEAPAEPRESPETVTEQEEADARPQSGERVPWWRRMFGS
jgi:excisionase family DNA binding protein